MISAGQAGRLAFADAIESVLERRPDRLPRMAGKTDRQIALEILEDLRVPAPEAHLPAIEAALEVALTTRTDQIRSEGRVHPGVEAVLEALHQHHAVQTLVTGNLAPNARTKLHAFGLDRWFDFDIGAYGSDHHDRDELVPMAVRRAGFQPDETWVVGDTPRDLQCARAGNAKCLLVATGGYSYDDLAGTDADALVNDLTDTETIVKLLT